MSRGPGHVMRHPRYAKRTTVRFGEGRLTCVGVVENLSLSGLFLTSTRVFVPGTKILIDFPLGNTTCRLEGMVRWARRGSATFMRVAPSGMGIEIISAPQAYQEMLLTIGAQRKNPHANVH